MGTAYEPTNIRRLAKANADAAMTKALSDIAISDVQRRAAQRLLRQEERKQRNIESITGKALAELPDDSRPEKIEEDWLAYFFQHCEDISDDEVQGLWSRLLAQEATRPGRFSRRTINFLATLDKRDANLFSQFSQFVIFFDQPIALVFDYKSPLYVNKGLDFEPLTHLDSIGLVKFEAATGPFSMTWTGPTEAASYGSQKLVFEFPMESGFSMAVGKVMLTQTGRELMSLCSVEFNEDFLLMVLGKFLDANVSVYSVLE